MGIQNWFERTAGDWRSERRYAYLERMSNKAGMVKKTDQISTAFTVGFDPTTQHEEFVTTIKWQSEGEDGQVSDGEMRCRGVHNQNGWHLQRDIGYFSDNATVSELQLLDEDTVVMTTSYGGATYREEIRLMFNDMVRLRQTIGHKTGESMPFLCGQYYEIRTNKSEEAIVD